MNKLLKWLKSNTTGTIVGGIAGLVFPFLASTFTAGKDLLTSFFKILHPLYSFGWLYQFQGYLDILALILIGAIIGAFIDSLWRKNR